MFKGYVVFTGKATDQFGNPIVRHSLTATAHKLGYVVQDRVDYNTNVLVASRTDTVKAKRASALGVTVKTYAEFVGDLVDGQN